MLRITKAAHLLSVKKRPLHRIEDSAGLNDLLSGNHCGHDKAC